MQFKTQNELEEDNYCGLTVLDQGHCQRAGWELRHDFKLYSAVTKFLI